MNIGIFTDTYTPQVNGVVTVVRTLKTELERRGHRAYVFTVGHPNAVSEEGVFRVKSVQFPKEPQHRIGVFVEKQTLDIARPLNLDIIHTHTEFSLHIASRWIRKKLSIPSIHTLHTYYQDYLYYAPPVLELFFKKNLPSIFRKILHGHSCTIAPSRKIESFLDMIKYSMPVHVVPNGIDISQFYGRSDETAGDTADFRRRFNIGQDDEMILFVGRLGCEKNLNTLLENFRKIHERRPCAKLVLAGDGPDRNALESSVCKMGIAASVVFTGYLRWPAEIKLAYTAADLFISASHSEVHPISFIEAMASGLPVVAADDASIEGMVINGENGWALEDDSLLWEKALEILENPALKAAMGKRSKDISRSYSVERFINSMIEIYELYKKK